MKSATLDFLRVNGARVVILHPPKDHREIREAARALYGHIRMDRTPLYKTRAIPGLARFVHGPRDIEGDSATCAQLAKAARDLGVLVSVRRHSMSRSTPRGVHVRVHRAPRDPRLSIAAHGTLFREDCIR